MGTAERTVAYQAVCTREQAFLDRWEHWVCPAPGSNAEAFAEALAAFFGGEEAAEESAAAVVSAAMDSIRFAAAAYGYDAIEAAEEIYALRLLEGALSGGSQLSYLTRMLELYDKTGTWMGRASAEHCRETAARALAGVSSGQTLPVDEVERIGEYAAIQYEKRRLLQP